VMRIGGAPARGAEAIKVRALWLARQAAGMGFEPTADPWPIDLNRTASAWPEVRRLYPINCPRSASSFRSPALAIVLSNVSRRGLMIMRQTGGTNVARIDVM
jgi:hypothetical protein